MNTRIDRKAAMRSTLTAERQSVQDRFATADAVLAQRPAGLASAAVESFAPIDVPPVPGPQDRQVIKVALDLIDDNPVNARHIYNPETVKAIAASMATHGQMVPALAMQHPSKPGRYMLVDGHYRKKAALAANLVTLDLDLRAHVGELELYRLSWLLNEERSAQSALDNAFAWKQLLAGGIATNENHIAELLGLSAATVNKTLALLRLPPSALEKVREAPEKFGVATGYEVTLMAKQIPEEEVLALVHRIVTEDLSSREVAELRSRLELPSQRKRKETSRQYKLKKDGRQVGWLKEWDSGKVSFEVQMGEAKDRAALVAELLQRFGVTD